MTQNSDRFVTQCLIPLQTVHNARFEIVTTMGDVPAKAGTK
jgi:hypothetical protein